MCKFANLPINVIIKLLNSVTGWQVTPQDLIKTGERIFNMKRLLLSLIILLQAPVFFTQPATASAQVPVSPVSSDILCLPGIYMTDPQDCLPIGPSSYRTRMASEGFSLPLINLPSHQIDRRWSLDWYLVYRYLVLSWLSPPLIIFFRCKSKTFSVHRQKILDQIRVKLFSGTCSYLGKCVFLV
jgi:hypothetical protein